MFIYCATLVANDDPSYEMRVRIYADDMVSAAVAAQKDCDRNWEDMKVIAIEEVGAKHVD